ncbi:3-hydroxybenzoate 6-hydroxylase [Ornithinimicrobium humiphilum]|uniref:FAD-dependent monooxygenase n=1 Tax=Ornithinimicrobium humiphilum TaxID=125288 RepID=UPI0031DDE1A6
MTSRTLDVLVVGGGIGGLSTALALGRAGLDVHLVEQAREFAEIGAGLQLGPNAVRAMDRLGVWEQVDAVAVRPRNGVIRDIDSGEVLTVIDFGQPFVDHYGYPYVVVHRHDLLEILVAAARELPNVSLEVRKRVVEVREGADVATVVFEDGDEYVARTVIGADGIRSRVRALHDTSEPVFSTHVAYRGAVPIERVKADIDLADMTLWMGPGRHFIHYPVRGGDLYNLVAVFESSWYLEGREDWGERAEFEEAFAPSCAPVQELMSLMNDHRKWPISDREPLTTWRTDHTVLLGDAAHAMLQYLGQGACQAMEDSLVLARSIVSQPSREAALADYEAQRIDRTTRCQRSARPWGALWHTADPTVLALRNRVFRARRADDYSEADWLYQDAVGPVPWETTPALTPSGAPS